MDKIKAVTKAAFAKLSAPFEWVVQKVRDYPKGFLIAWGVSLVVVGLVF